MPTTLVAEPTACGRCGARIEHPVWTAEDDRVCQDCRDRIYVHDCQRCGYPTANINDTADDGDICNCCARDYWCCDDCGELIDGDDLCRACEDFRAVEDDLWGDLVRHAGYKPAPEFHGEGPLYLGLELEIDTPRGGFEGCADLVLHELGRLAYLKEDGSIAHGFEVVTHPMDYRWAADNFPWAVLAALAENGCSGEGNGLHVHISRDGFDSPAHVYRWMQLLYRNAWEVCAIARRVSEQWARFSPDDRTDAVHYAKGAKAGPRYRAINATNEHTFELRIFASSLNPREVQAALALAAASVEYTRTLRVRDILTCGGWEWASFAAWVRGRAEYAPLAEEMEQHACAC